MRPKELAAYRAPRWDDLPDLDLYMDQVIGVLEKHLSFFFGEEKVLTAAMINNYVKNRLLPPPVNKKYGREHLARLLELCVFKSFLQLSEADALIGAAWQGLSPAEAHDRFCEALDRGVRLVFFGEQGAETKDPVERALNAACTAAACILCARIRFREALPPAEKESPGSPEDKKEDKKKKGK